MSSRNTFIRSLHDIGLATWFGGSLMGAVGLNGATAKAENPHERLRLSSLGWARWAPVQIAAILAHGVGGIGLIGGNKARLAIQQESRTNTGWKLALTIVAGATTFYSAVLGRRIAKHSDEPTDGVTEPADGASNEFAAAQQQQPGPHGRATKRHPDEGARRVTEPDAASSTELAIAQRRQRILQWVTPALTLVLIALAAQQGEQQRPISGFVKTTLKNLHG